LAGICEEMCKEVNAYPKCAQCPEFVAPDSTPGVMTWPELLDHMDNLVAWGQDSIKGWHKQASELQRGHHAVLSAVEQKSVVGQSACSAQDLKYRAAVQNKLAGICEEMCKEVNAYPKCAQCPEFVAPDSTPGVMTWPELLDHMDNLVAWGQDSIKGWHKQASELQQGHHVVSAVQQKSVVEETACSAEDLSHRAQLQNKLAGICEEMCKEVNAYPKCAQGPELVACDSTAGVMSWAVLLDHMDNLVAWGQDSIKGWHKQADAF
jgi:aryl carrier-like protein